MSPGNAPPGEGSTVGVLVHITGLEIGPCLLIACGVARTNLSRSRGSPRMVVHSGGLSPLGSTTASVMLDPVREPD